MNAQIVSSASIGSIPAAPAERIGWWRAFRRHAAFHIILVFVLVQLACVVVAIMAPSDFRYLYETNVNTMLKSIPMLGIVALGVGMLMIAGEFDLSVGAVFVLSSYIMAYAFSAGVWLPLAVCMGLAVGLLVGFINGMITVRTGIPSFIATLGSMMVVRGVVRFVSNSRPILFNQGETMDFLFDGSIWVIQMQFLWFIGFAFIAYLLLSRHRLGNHIYMVGGNPRAAVAVGINANRVKIICFMLSSLCASVAGIIGAVRVDAVTPTGGTGLELQAIAACVIGGLFLSGGRGTAIGMVLGATLMFTIEDVLLLSRAPGFYLEVFIGSIIVIAVVANTYAARRQQ